ncbi:MAG: hypothetical protein AAGG53_04205, partial [Cyanobacteria bacterium P01_H01_bin.152]
ECHAEVSHPVARHTRHGSLYPSLRPPFEVCDRHILSSFLDFQDNRCYGKPHSVQVILAA